MCGVSPVYIAFSFTLSGVERWRVVPMSEYFKENVTLILWGECRWMAGRMRTIDESSIAACAYRSDSMPDKPNSPDRPNYPRWGHDVTKPLIEANFREDFRVGRI